MHPIKNRLFHWINRKKLLSKSVRIFRQSFSYRKFSFVLCFALHPSYNKNSKKTYQEGWKWKSQENWFLQDNVRKSCFEIVFCVICTWCNYISYQFSLVEKQTNEYNLEAEKIKNIACLCFYTCILNDWFNSVDIA